MILRDRPRFEFEVPVLVIGAGACGLTAALAARDRGAEVLVLERDASPAGSTSLSSGFVPAAPTRAQAAKGIEDSAAAFAADILAKSHGTALPDLVRIVTEASGPAIDWLGEAHGLGWEVLDGFLYPGHSRHRMHALAERTGAALEARLLAAATAAGAEVATGARVDALHAEGDRVTGVRVRRPDGSEERIGCRALVLASSGYGGDPELVRAHIPEMAGAPYFGHPGNTGDALRWGMALGGRAAQLSGCQGHGSVAHPHGVLVTWAVMMEGGIQVNAEGRRFANEHRGYSEQALDVLRQPGGIAWDILDARLLALARGFPDFRAAEAAGAVRMAADEGALAAATGCPAEALATTLAHARACAEGAAADPLGRDFTGRPALAPPYAAVRVTGALFHTQGGLLVDGRARVLGASGPLPNLFAGGGAACGVSGPDPAGYLSGNGLLTAVALGRLAGAAAARLVAGG